MFALLAFVIASAAFRAFRARSVEATLLLITAIVMMIGRVSIGRSSRPSPGHHRMAARRPEPRGKRAIALGVGLGAVSTALKIISASSRATREILSHDLVKRLLAIDRRIIFLLVALGVVLPLLHPLNLRSPLRPG